MEMSVEFYESLGYAFKLRKEENYFESVTQKIRKISGYDEIKELWEQRDEMMFHWIPTIIFNCLGYEKYKTCDLNIESSRTFIMCRPNESYDCTIINGLKRDYNIEEFTYHFSPWLVASLYGGYPWFKAYYRICDEYHLLNKEGQGWFVTSSKGENCVKKIVEMKNTFRDEHPEQTLIQTFEGEKYKGVLHPFHTPNCIENEMHMNAIIQSL